MSEWKEYRLGDISKTIQTGPFGSQLHQSDYVEDGIPCIMPKNIGQHLDINYDDIAKIKQEDVTRLSRHKVSFGDIVYSRRGDIEKCAYITSEQAGWLCGTGCLKVSINDNLADSRFIAYYLSLPQTKNWLKKSAVGTTMLNLNTSILSDVPIVIPAIATQRRISSILSSLDDKIAINRRICENLEAQAQALFKHWFIDFAPYKNGKFVESELGMIPEGWRVGRYSDIIQETISGDWGKENAEGNYTHKVACIRGCDFQDVKMGLRGKTPERYILEKNYQAKHFEDKDVLVEISGGTATVSTGRVCPVSQLLIDKYNGDIVCTNFCRLVRPCKGFSSYLYYSWKYKYDHKVMFGYENGTSGIKNFSIKDFSTREPLVLPDLSALKDFERIIEHIHAQIQNYGSESSRLSTLRDTLLPKLMSGEIKV